MNSLWCKTNVKRFGFDNLHQDFDIIRIILSAMDAGLENRNKENVYNERFINVLLKISSTCLALEIMFEKGWIFKRTFLIS